MTPDCTQPGGAVIVKAIFVDNYSGDLSGFVWIVDTRSNRARFERARALDHSSALFSMDPGSPLESVLRQTVFNIQDHYPDLKSITVIGLELSVVETLADMCRITPTTDGIMCRFCA